jgi:hypothetical protein
MINFLFRKRIRNNNWIFNGSYIDAKALYLYMFNEIPSISYITGVDTTRALEWFRKTMPGKAQLFQHSEYDREAGKLLFNVTFIVLPDQKIIEIGNEYVSLLHDQYSRIWTTDILSKMKTFQPDKATESNARIGFATQQNTTN